MAASRATQVGQLAARFEAPIKEAVRFVKAATGVCGDRGNALAAMQAAKHDLDSKKVGLWLWPRPNALGSREQRQRAVAGLEGLRPPASPQPMPDALLSRPFSPAAPRPLLGQVRQAARHPRLRERQDSRGREGGDRGGGAGQGRAHQVGVSGVGGGLVVPVVACSYYDRRPPNNQSTNRPKQFTTPPSNPPPPPSYEELVARLTEELNRFQKERAADTNALLRDLALVQVIGGGEGGGRWVAGGVWGWQG
jgi:hypothetical protein